METIRPNFINDLECLINYTVQSAFSDTNKDQTLFHNLYRSYMFMHT